MTKAVVVTAHGGPEVLEFKDWAAGEPGPGQLLVKQRAIGVNFVDVYQRTGLYPANPPFVAGNEGAGEVLAVGEGVTGINRVIALSIRERRAPTRKSG